MHYLRLKKARQKAMKRWTRFQRWCPDTPFTIYTKPVEALIGMGRKTGTFCSGPCCGNLRRHFGEKTVQEMKADIDMNQQLEELE